jgi:hypothetical protein
MHHSPAERAALLHKRAQLATRTGASAVIARSHIEQALRHAEGGRLDLATLNDLSNCLATIDRTIRHAELCRLRLLRKADRTANLLPNEE